MSNADLPDVLELVADACGRDVALALAKGFGGTEITIPMPDHIGATHPLATALGQTEAAAVAKVLSPGRIRIPFGPSGTAAKRRADYRRMFDAGSTNGEVARALNVHIRAVEYQRRAWRERRL